MPFPNQNYNKRDYLLPAGCKDLTDAMKLEEQAATRRVGEPPITRHITLPEKVSVRYLAELTGQSLHSLAMVMYKLAIYVSVERSIDFDDAARLLRRYGIQAIKGV